MTKYLSVVARKMLDYLVDSLCCISLLLVHFRLVRTPFGLNIEYREGFIGKATPFMFNCPQQKLVLYIVNDRIRQKFKHISTHYIEYQKLDSSFTHCQNNNGGNQSTWREKMRMLITDTLFFSAHR